MRLYVWMVGVRVDVILFLHFSFLLIFCLNEIDKDSAINSERVLSQRCRKFIIHHICPDGEKEKYSIR